MRFFLLGLLLLIGCGGSQTTRTMLYTASSALPVVESLRQQHQPEFFVTGGSSAVLARQIVGGAPVDAYLSANLQWMQAVTKVNLHAAKSQRVLLQNRLVVVMHKDTKPAYQDWQALFQNVAHEVAIADLETVPLGMYTAQALESTDLLAKANAKDKSLVAQNALETLKLVLRGEANYAVVYATDAKANKELKVFDEIDASLHEPINYYLAALNPRGDKLVKFLQGKAALAAFREAGFLLPAKGR